MRLHVYRQAAKKDGDDPLWQEKRQFAFGDIGQSVHVEVCHIQRDGQWSQNYRGPIRFDSAEKIVEPIAAAAKQGGM